MTQAPTPAHPAERPARPDPKIAHGWLHTARFLTTAPQLQHLPALDLPEIAFVGRSNAGKSTSINTLTQQKRLAFASKTPGRTQSINLFALGKQGETDAVLADLPGYGYAAVPREAKLRWQRVMANYLVTRENLRAVVLLCDPRLGIGIEGSGQPPHDSENRRACDALGKYILSHLGDRLTIPKTAGRATRHGVVQDSK